MPHAQFAILTIIILGLLALIIIGELKKLEKILGCFPLLMSRSGRGMMIFAIGLITCCRNKVVLGLSIVAMLVGILNIILGSRDDHVTIDKAYQSTARESNAMQTRSQSKPQANNAPQRNVDIEGFDNNNAII